MNLDEERYRQDAKNQIKKWSNFLRTVREYLYQKGYLEVTTSSLVKTGAFESTIDPLRVQSLKDSWELHTSPEMEMKRLIALSPANMFQVTKCFRDDPDTDIHGKEFTMLEFYKMGANYLDIIRETKELFSLTNGSPISFKEVTIAELFQSFQLDLNQLTTKELFKSALIKHKLLECEENDSWEDLFFKMMIEKIEPSFDFGVAYIVKDYPAVTSVLSKKIPNTIYAERFEVYWKNKELCNGCTEATDPLLLKSNFELENSKRKFSGKSYHPCPEEFFTSMKNFPECSGVAIGLDRLFHCIR